MLSLPPVLGKLLCEGPDPHTQAWLRAGSQPPSEIGAWPSANRESEIMPWPHMPSAFSPESVHLQSGVPCVSQGASPPSDLDPNNLIHLLQMKPPNTSSLHFTLESSELYLYDFLSLCYFNNMYYLPEDIKRRNLIA